MKNERESRLLCDVMPENGNLLSCPYHLRPNDVARGADVTMSSRSQRSPSTSPRQRRASACGWSAPHHSQLLASGYEQYQKSLLEVPWPADYGEASSDDLSSEWDSDVPDVPSAPPSKVS
jgi:1D-myo-inositol-triphosphate 3-kinase